MKRGLKMPSHAPYEGPGTPLKWLRKISKRISSKEHLHNKEESNEQSEFCESSIMHDERTIPSDQGNPAQECSDPLLSGRKRLRVDSQTSQDSPRISNSTCKIGASQQEVIQRNVSYTFDASDSCSSPARVWTSSPNYKLEDSDDEEVKYLDNLTSDCDFNRNTLLQNTDAIQGAADEIGATADSKPPKHLQKDFLGSILVPQPRFDKYWRRDTLVITPNSFMKNISLGLLQQDITQRHGRCNVFRKMFEPSTTALNMKLFGGKKAVQQEQEKSRKAGLVIHPCSKFRIYWDFVMITTLAMNIYVLPLDLAFFSDDIQRPWFYFNVISDTLFLIDILLNFRTGYRVANNATEYQLKPKKIAIHYLKTWFVIDILGSLPFDYIILAATGHSEAVHFKSASRALKFLKIAKLINLLKLLRISRILRGISQYEAVYSLTTGLMRYVKLVSMMLLVAHWNGCLHFMVPMLQDFPAKCWVSLTKLQMEPWYVQYGWALFNALSHMLCIGYGRVIPEMLSEAVLTIFSMVTGATFYALFIATSMAYILQVDSSKNHYNEKFKQIEEYMIYRNIPNKLKRKIAEYYEHKYHQGRFFDEKQVLSEVSQPLRNEIVNHTCQFLVETVPFFKYGGQEFVSFILNELTFEVYLVGDHIIKEGTRGSEMYFIRRGFVDIIVGGTVIACLGEGSYFGEHCLLTDLKRVFSARASTVCDLFVLSKENFTKALEEHPNMRDMVEHVSIERLIHLRRKFYKVIDGHIPRRCSTPKDDRDCRRIMNCVVKLAMDKLPENVFLDPTFDRDAMPIDEASQKSDVNGFVFRLESDSRPMSSCLSLNSIRSCDDTHPAQLVEGLHQLVIRHFVRRAHCKLCNMCH